MLQNHQHTPYDDTTKSPREILSVQPDTALQPVSSIALRPVTQQVIMERQSNSIDQEIQQPVTYKVVAQTDKFHVTKVSSHKDQYHSRLIANIARPPHGKPESSILAEYHQFLLENTTFGVLNGNIRIKEESEQQHLINMQVVRLKHEHFKKHHKLPTPTILTMTQTRAVSSNNITDIMQQELYRLKNTIMYHITNIVLNIQGRITGSRKNHLTFFTVPARMGRLSSTPIAIDHATTLDNSFMPHNTTKSIRTPQHNSNNMIGGMYVEQITRTQPLDILPIGPEKEGAIQTSVQDTEMILILAPTDPSLEQELTYRLLCTSILSPSVLPPTPEQQPPLKNTTAAISVVHLLILHEIVAKRTCVTLTPFIIQPIATDANSIIPHDTAEWIRTVSTNHNNPPKKHMYLLQTHTKILVSRMTEYIAQSLFNTINDTIMYAAYTTIQLLTTLYLYSNACPTKERHMHMTKHYPESITKKVATMHCYACPIIQPLETLLQQASQQYNPTTALAILSSNSRQYNHNVTCVLQELLKYRPSRTTTYQINDILQTVNINTVIAERPNLLKKGMLAHTVDINNYLSFMINMYINIHDAIQRHTRTLNEECLKQP